MLSPGSKNWVKKYFQLIEEGEIKVDFLKPSKEEIMHFLHAEFFQSGVMFGYPCKLIFANNLDQTTWTLDETLKVLLLESLLKTYLVFYEKLDEEDFLNEFNQFIDVFESRGFEFAFPKLKTPDNYSKLESILEKRIHGRKKWSNIFWTSYLNNSLVFLDVVGFFDYLNNEHSINAESSKFAESCVTTIALAAYADGKLDKAEENVLNVFYSAQGVKSSYVNFLKKNANSLNFEDVPLPKNSSLLFRLFLLDLAAMTVFSDLITEDEERYFLQMFCKHLGLTREDLNKSIVLIESFVISNNHKITFLQEMSTYDRLYSNFSKRWIKVLGRNKDKLVDELKNNKELLELVNKSAIKELSEEEKEKVKTQFKELIRSMPALAIFMLPGGALLLPIITRVIPDLLPNSFRNNQINKSNDEKNN